MNKKLSMAVAGAVMAFGASAANAGITIPAGDWTIDIGGNVNTFYTNTRFSGDLEVDGQLGKGQFTDDSANTIQTGLLPSALGIGGKTRQNDLDIAFQFTFFVGADSGGQTSGGGNSLNIRQAFLTFGDASWGSIKMGRDLGIFASDAILSDMTLLGVGTAAGSNGSSTLGRIGSGYEYADWKGQITYSSPNWNGFDFAVGITQGWTNGIDNTNSNLGYEGKVGYSWAGDVSGKVWAGFLSQQHEGSNVCGGKGKLNADGSCKNSKTSPLVHNGGYTSNAWDIGAKVAVAGFGLVGYYYDGNGLSGTGTASGSNFSLNGLNYLLIGSNETDDRGGYVQGTYTIAGANNLKLGVSWGESQSDAEHGHGEFTNESWVIGAYYPITKSLNLVAEYTDMDLEGTNSNGVATSHDNNKLDGSAQTIAIGAIMFF